LDGGECDYPGKKISCPNKVSVNLNKKGSIHYWCSYCGFQSCLKGCVKPHLGKSCEENLAELEAQRVQKLKEL
jgi:hypothetical protein